MRKKQNNLLIKQKDYSRYPFMNHKFEDMKGEKWAEISQFDGYYFISNYGRIWAIPRPVFATTGQAYYTRELIRKQVVMRYYNSYTKDYTDQLVVKLRYGYENYSFQVCRLVYDAFVGPIPEGLRIVHKDSDNCNNRFDNLVAMNGTSIYAQGLKLNRRPRTSHLAKKESSAFWSPSTSPRAIVKYSLAGKKIAEYESVIEAAVANDSHRGSIRQVATKKFKQLDGFVYRYKGDGYGGEFADFAWEKQVTQYTLEGKKLTAFESVKGAAEHTGIDANTISKCALFKCRLAGGYVWRYEGDRYAGEYRHEIKNMPRPMVQYALDGKKIAEYSSVNQAAAATGFSAATLLACAHKKANVSHGFVWRFQGEEYRGQYKHHRVGIPVTQWTLTGKKVQSFSTIKAAAENTGLTEANIQKNVQGANYTAGGFVWKKATEDEAQKLPHRQEQGLKKPLAPGTEIVQYSLDGKKIAHYNSVAQAARKTGIAVSGISLSLRLPTRLAGGFVWRVKGNRYYGRLAKDRPANKAKVVTQYDLQGRKLHVYQSTRQAEKETGVSSSTISAVAMGKLKTSGNFIWLYGNSKRRISVDEYFGPGNNGSSRPGKPVAKYSLEGELLATYPSITLAAQAEQISIQRISAAINGRSKSAVGYLWRVIGN
jgi:hypothetical protein